MVKIIDLVQEGSNSKACDVIVHILNWMPKVCWKGEAGFIVHTNEC
jgi:hypothetical protein